MRIALEYFGPARDAAGVSREVLDVPDGTTARGVVARRAAEVGGRLAALLLHEGEVGRTVLVAVNDRQVGEDVALRDGDEVLVIPPVSGGSGSEFLVRGVDVRASRLGG